MRKAKLVLQTCPQCQANFEIPESQLKARQKRGWKRLFCSRRCADLGLRKQPIDRICAQCGKSISDKVQGFRKYCSRSCSATYNNTHKAKGIRVSKIEIYIQKELIVNYPSLEFIFNGKEAIGSELDIYIPSLKLAFELNGIFHYEPIFGEQKLDKIQINDRNKFQACQKEGISLCIIDISKLTYFKEDKVQEFADIIKSIINSCL